MSEQRQQSARPEQAAGQDKPGDAALRGAAKAFQQILKQRHPDLHFEVTIKPPDDDQGGED